jgi:Bacterial Ig-like domain (group 3)/FG-GAP-like repeat
MTYRNGSAVLFLGCFFVPALYAATQPTTTSLTLSSSSVPLGTVVTLKASAQSGGKPVSPGRILFLDGGTTIGAGQLIASGTVTIELRLGLGSHSITASFAGTSGFAKSSSAASPLSVSGLAPTTTLISFTGANNQYSLTGKVTSYGRPAATGTVSFANQTAGTTLGSLPLNATSSPSFQPPQTYPFFSQPGVVAIGDFNRDGIPDMAVIVGAGVTIFLGIGDGSFREGASYSVGTSPQGLVVEDFNSDGFADLAVTDAGPSNGGGPYSVWILLGNGDGTFAPPGQPSSVDESPGQIVSADFNGDGIPDLALINGGDAEDIDVLLGKGDGTFLPVQGNFLGAEPNSLAAADLNGDGIVDLVVANAAGSGVAEGVSVLLGNGDGTFQSPQNIPVNGIGSLTVGDFNRDGVVDLAIEDGEDGSVGVLLGNGNGTFQTVQSYPGTPGGTLILAADFNGDGFLDLAVPNSSNNTVQVFYGTGTGAFGAPQAYTAGSDIGALAAADFNGDGLSDLAAATREFSVNVLIAGITASTNALTNLSIPGSKMQTVVASYEGDSAHQASTSPAIGLTPTSIRSLTFSANSISFGNQSTVGQGRVITLTNAGTDLISSLVIELGGETPWHFSESTSCGSKLAAGASCTVQVSFTPSDEISYSAALVVHSDAPGAPVTIPLTGTGVRSLSFSATSLALSANSPTQSLTITNNGSIGVDSLSVTVNGANASDFTLSSNTCGTSLAPGASCTVGVTFNPPGSSNYTALLEIHSDAPNAPAKITMTGAGISQTQEALTFTPNSLYFFVYGTETQNVQVVNHSSNTVNGISVVLDAPSFFSVTTTCGSSLAVNGTCTISVSFDGEFTDVEGDATGGSGYVNVYSSLPGPPAMIPISGQTNTCGFHGAPPCEPD